MIGIINFEKAINLAVSRGLDLVLISSGETPVAKIADFNKLQYEQKKKDKENKKRQFVPKLKEIDFGLTIGANDYEIKLKKIIDFLSNKDNVKIVVKMEKRIAISNSEYGMEFMNRILTDLSEYAVCQNKPKLFGNQITVVIVSKR